MIELYAWLSVHAVAADEDLLALEIPGRIMEAVQEILRQTDCGIAMQYRNGQPFLQTAFCANHRTAETDAIIGTYSRISETASGSYGVLYLRDNEDPVYYNEMQVWYFRRGTVAHRIMPEFSPCIPKLEDAAQPEYQIGELND